MSDLQLSELIRNYAIVIGGAIGIGIAIWRGISLSTQAKAAQKQAEIAGRSHVTELFSRAVGQLRDDKLEIRLGAIYTLRQLCADYPEFSRPVMMLLAAYVRQRTATNPAASEEDDVREILAFLSKNLQQE